MLDILVDQLPDEKTEMARLWLADLRDAADADGPALDAETLAALDREIADVKAGRVMSFSEYGRERGL